MRSMSRVRSVSDTGPVFQLCTVSCEYRTKERERESIKGWVSERPSGQVVVEIATLNLWRSLFLARIHPGQTVS